MKYPKNKNIKIDVNNLLLDVFMERIAKNSKGAKIKGAKFENVSFKPYNTKV